MATKKKTQNLHPHDIRELKGKLHHIKPTIILDKKQLTDELLQNIDNALNEYELIKIRAHTDSSEELTMLANEICTKAKAVLVQIVGYIIAVYRKNVVAEES